MFSSRRQEKIEDVAAIQPALYVHVPFCASTCDFCGFYQKAGSRADLLHYLDGMKKESSRWGGSFQFHSVFWGGGTPGLLPASDMEVLLELCSKRVQESSREWSIEWAPSTVKKDKVRTCISGGMNRASLGVQSFSEKALDALGRRHSPRQVQQAIDLLRDNGCDNLNLDLIFAIPGQSIEEWEEDLHEAIRREPEHISTYCLTFEEDTALYVKLSKGIVTRSEEKEREFYLRTWEILGEAGYVQYEVSNFARPGSECQHNLNTWRMGEWLGWGPSAASQFKGHRFQASPDLARWLEDVESSPYVPDGGLPRGDVVKPEDLQVDRWIFGLRMTEGVNEQPEDPRSFQRDFSPLWNQLEDSAYLERRNGRLYLTTEGKLRADGIGSAILEF